MLEMTKAINKQFFPDHKPKPGESVLGRVTCYTCHQGEATPKRRRGNSRGRVSAVDHLVRLDHAAADAWIEQWTSGAPGRRGVAAPLRRLTGRSGIR